MFPSLLVILYGLFVLYFIWFIGYVYVNESIFLVLLVSFFGMDFPRHTESLLLSSLSSGYCKMSSPRLC